MTPPSKEAQQLPPLAVIDAIDNWVHNQTRFHLPDTDGYKEMLADVAKALAHHQAIVKIEGKIEALSSIGYTDLDFGGQNQITHVALHSTINNRIAELEQQKAAMMEQST